MTPAEELAAAADKLGAVAGAATRGPWTVAQNSSTSDSHGPTKEHGSWAVLSPEIDDENPVTMVAGPERDPRNGSLWGGIWEPVDAEYIAAMDPLVGKALAAQLRAYQVAVERHWRVFHEMWKTEQRIRMMNDQMPGLVQALDLARLINGTGS